MPTSTSPPATKENKNRGVIRLDDPLVSRLIGMETEYATLVADRQNLSTEDLPTARLVYGQICEAIRRDQPTVVGLFDHDQLFLANGGAVTFESHPSVQSMPGGLIEIATPEVRSPSDLLACQRAIDELAEEATVESETSFDLRILKNSSDALGHVYGCQENYEADVATGVGLFIYRGFVLLLWAMQVASLLLALPLMTFVIFVSATATVLQMRRSRSKGRQAVTGNYDETADLDDSSSSDDFEGNPFEPGLFNHPSIDDDSHAGESPHDEFDDYLDVDTDGFPNSENETESQSQADLFQSLPHWLSTFVVVALRLVHLPIVLVLTFVARHIAFRRQRKYLTSLLVSRVALCGAGDYDIEGRYSMSAKAMAIDSVTHMGGFRGERPIFVFGHWLGQYCAKSFMSLGSTRQMLAKRQRLQISLSDSNLSDLAEYVKFGSVSLVLDMIENGHTDGLPLLKKPVEATHRIASDWNLVSRVDTDRGSMSALEIQQAYLKAAEAFVEAAPGNMHGESGLVLYRWKELFDAAKAFRNDARDLDMAIGRIDWLTKRHLIDQLGSQAEWQDRKKVDLRYHELSEEGYYRQIVDSAGRSDLRLVTDDQIERRRRSPPAGSPASRRSWLIREFAGSDEILQSEWSYAMVGRGRKRRRIEFVKTNG